MLALQPFRRTYYGRSKSHYDNRNIDKEMNKE